MARRDRGECARQCGRNRRAKRLAAGLALALVCACLAGCGGSAADADDGDAQPGKVETGEVQPGSPAAGDAAMGRYLEETVELSEGISDYGNQIFRLADGRLLLTDPQKQMQESQDNGVTWNTVQNTLLAELFDDQAYLADCAVGGDGTLAFLYEKLVEEPEDGATEADGGRNAEEAAAVAASGKEEGTLQKGLAIVRPDGTEIQAALTVMEEEGGARRVWVSGGGRVFVGTYEDTLYEVLSDGTSEAFLVLEGMPGLVQFQGELLIADGPEYDALVIYDMQQGVYMEDPALDEFVRGHYSDRSFGGGSWYDLYFFPGEEGVLYLAGETGMYRHVIGGAAVEQVIDGRLSSLGNPAYKLRGMTMLDGREFLAVFMGARIVRYVYDPDVPAVPAEKITAYSLKENNTLRQAIFSYQTANPEVYVEYEIGMEEGSAATRDDALKKLNTQIMAGEGPDLLLLDDLPVDSYIEKGVLLDLSSVVDSLSGEESLFPNIVDAFRTQEGLFCLPAEVLLPVVAGHAEDIGGMEDLEGLAEGTERLRQKYPGEDLFQICSERGIMKQFAIVCASAWTAEDGSVRRDGVAEFLTQTKRIYDAQMNGLPEKKRREYEERQEEALRYDGETMEESDYFAYGINELAYIMGYTQLIAGSVGYPYAYAELTSVERVPEYEDFAFQPMRGQCGQVFIAETLTGINAASQNMEHAQGLLRMLVGTQDPSSLGFPVNRAAFEDSLFPDDFVSEEEAYSGIGMTDEEGQTVSFAIYWYGKEDADILREWMAAVDTPYVRNKTLEEAVYEAGTAYMRGNRSLEEAVDDVEKSMGIYLAE